MGESGSDHECLSQLMLFSAAGSAENEPPCRPRLALTEGIMGKRHIKGGLPLSEVPPLYHTQLSILVVKNCAVMSLGKQIYTDKQT